MRVLQLCQKPPLPAIDGGCLASLELSNNLLALGYDVKIISLAPEKHPFRPDEIDADFQVNTKMEAIEIKTRIKVSDVANCAFNRKSIQKHRFFQKKVLEKIRSHLSNHAYDIIILDGLMTCYYLKDIRKITKAKLIYRSHNIEYDIFSGQAHNENHPLKMLVLNREASHLRRFEEDIWQTADVIWAISEIDKQKINAALSNRERAVLLPFSSAPMSAKKEAEPHTFFHLGAMDWKPNVAGLTWFIKSIWPEILKKNPEARLHLGGKSIKSKSKKLKGERIIIHENVKNASEFYGRYEILIVPLLSGSGVRVKMIQAMSMGKIIISTPAGASGLGAVSGEHLIIAKDAEDMISQANEVLGNKALKKKLSAGALSFFKENFSTEIVRDKMLNLVNSLF